jgi:threonine/homoserine/homoserine lactone efflux protein
MIFQALLEGIGFGLGLAFLIGPVFFTLIQISIDKGARMGASMAAGVVSSDFVIMLIAYLFLDSLRSLTYFDAVIAIFGGLALIVIGIGMAFKKARIVQVDDSDIVRKDYYKAFTKGFLLNTLNPFAFVFWAGISSMLSLRAGFKAIDEWTFLFGLLLSVFGTDLTKVYMSKRIKRYLKPNALLWINRVSGVFLAGFGIRLFLYSFEKFVW